MDARQFHRIAKALADERRFEILERIAQVPEMACAKLAEDLPVSQATISHHLKELFDAGLLDVRREAKYAYYRLQPETWSEYLASLRKRLAPKPNRTTGRETNRSLKS